MHEIFNKYIWKIVIFLFSHILLVHWKFCALYFEIILRPPLIPSKLTIFWITHVPV